MEIKLKKHRLFEGDNQPWWKEGNSNINVFCHTGLRRRVEIPRHVETIVLIFTKRPNSESWKIRDKESDLAPGHRGVEGYNGGLCSRFMELANRAYKAGYRYAHIEYEE